MGRQIAGLRHWLGTNVVPVVLVPLAALLVWVAIWKVWLPDPGAVNIVLDPGAAFGTGSHATTRLCLEWLERRSMP